MHHRLRMQAGRTAAENVDQLLAETRSTAGRRDHQHAVQAEPGRLVADALDRTGGEHDALGLDIVNERCDHPTRPPASPPTVRH